MDRISKHASRASSPQRSSWRQQPVLLLLLAVLAIASCRSTSAAMPRSLHSTTTRSEDVDVVIVGAGFAGLTAARILSRANYSVAVVEANSVIGGRGKRWLLQPPAVKADLWVDLGGQWVGERQYEFIKLLKEYKIPTYQSPHELGNVAFVWDNETLGKKGACWDCVTFPTEANIEKPGPMLEVLNETIAHKDPRAPGVQAMIDAMIAFGDVAERVSALSRESAYVLELDGMTYQDWVYNQTDNELARQVLILGASIGNTEPWWASALSFAEAALTGPLPDSPEGFLIQGGAGQIPQRLAQDVEAHNGRILVNQAVIRIQHDVGGVTVHSENRAFRAGAVVVAMPPHLAGRIEYAPPLPSVFDQLAQRAFMGLIIKCVATYERPFWRSDPKSNLTYVLFPQGKGPVKNMYDISPPAKFGGGGSGVLAGFIDAGATEWSGATGEELKAAVLASFAEIVGPGAMNASGFVAKNWGAEPFTGGAYSTVFPPGTITQFAEGLVSPAGVGGRIFWAGTDTAEAWGGFFEGAIISGQEVADKIMRDPVKVPKTGKYTGKLKRKSNIGSEAKPYLGPGGYVL